jgi:cytochrome c oxidase subunit 4
MSGHSVEDIKRETRTYVLVFVALAALTVVTVAVSYLDLSLGPAVALALFIAAIKGSLVAGFFMHLISERKLIYSVLILTAIFFVALMVLPIGTDLGSTRL